MFSRMADTFHATCPSEAQDALRLDVKPEQGPHMEVLSFYFPLVEGKEANAAAALGHHDGAARDSRVLPRPDNRCGLKSV